MSGGHFDYIQYRVEDVADQIERMIDDGEYAEVQAYFAEAALTIRNASKMMQRIDWLVSDDDGIASFKERWAQEGLPRV